MKKHYLEERLKAYKKFWSCMKITWSTKIESSNYYKENNVVGGGKE